MRPSKKTLIVEWVHTKAQIERLEKKKNELKVKLEAVLEKEPEQTLEIDGWRCVLVKSSRENFSLKEAYEKLDPIEMKALKPFISVSKFTQVRTSWQGGSEEPSV